jgi:hypothetical protein
VSLALGSRSAVGTFAGGRDGNSKGTGARACETMVAAGTGSDALRVVRWVVAGTVAPGAGVIIWAPATAPKNRIATTT